MAEVTIRRMRRADVPTVAALEAATFTMPWSEATFRSLLRRRDVDALVARDDAGSVVGYAVAWGVYDQGELANIMVVPELLGSGLGARLLDDLLVRLEARGIRQLFLEVREANARARRFYERHGFRVLEVFPVPPNGPPLWLMWREPQAVVPAGTPAQQVGLSAEAPA